MIMRKINKLRFNRVTKTKALPGRGRVIQGRHLPTCGRPGDVVRQLSVDTELLELVAQRPERDTQQLRRRRLVVVGAL